VAVAEELGLLSVTVEQAVVSRHGVIDQLMIIIILD